MSSPISISLLIISAGLVFAPWADGQLLLLDDTWADGDRTDTNLPEESAWFANNVVTTPTLSVVTNALTGHGRMFDTNTSSRLWISHYAPEGSPVELAPGESLRITLHFIPRGVTPAPASARGLRFGLFNFSEPGAARVTGDGFSTGTGTGAPGANVTGYMLNMNFGQTFSAGPLQIMKRTDTASVSLMGTLGVYTAIGNNGGGDAGSPGFRSDVPYVFEFTVRRNDTSADITTRFADTDGWSISHTVTDATSPNLRFDGFGIRPNSVADSAEAFTFSRFKVEKLPPQLRITSVRLVIPEGLDITWNTIPGKTYQVEWRAAVAPAGTWTLLDTIMATGDSASVRDFDAFFEPQRFYRVAELP